MVMFAGWPCEELEYSIVMLRANIFVLPFLAVINPNLFGLVFKNSRDSIECCFYF